MAPSLCLGCALLSVLSYFGTGGGVDHPILDCDHMYVHTDEGLTEGSFTSRNYPKKYPPNLQCIYTFIAKEHFRVKLVFNSFQLAGTSSKCEDYIDIYSVLESPDVDLISQTLTGRYCGSVSPKIIISLHNVVVIIFHVRSNSLGAEGFAGTYSFISERPYSVGTRLNPKECHYLIYSSQTSHGSIRSPTYPGKYPGNMQCIYQMIGEPGERIRLEFEDFDVYFGGDHCPYDSLTIYDGDSHYAPIVHKVCGLQQSLELYSENENLYLEFVTVSEVASEHRGFQIAFKFSKDFVSIDRLIGGQQGVAHLRGTECDLRVRSRKENEIVIMSPNHPSSYPMALCTYYIDGLKGAQDLEKVLLHFEVLSITSLQKDCEDAHVALYLNGQNVGANSADLKYCSTNLATLPDTVESNGPRMVLVQRTGNSTSDHGFKAVVRFETDFGIPGTPASDSNECTFHFNSLSSSEGIFSSPRYPENYPVDTTCVYWLNGRVGQRVHIYFDQFVLAPSLSRAGRCADRLELFNVYPNNRETILGNYCAENYPGPILSAEDANRVRAVFFSDVNPTATGFRAHYRFVSQKFVNEVAQKNQCSQKIVSSISGTISSPNFPIRYVKNLICDWEIRVRRGYRILVQPIVLNVEGVMGDDGLSRNCRSAVIRIRNESSGHSNEFCGEKVVPGIRQFVSAKNVIYISFRTHPEKVNGLKGFNLSWTEFKLREDCEGPEYFHCNFSRICISSKVRCNELIDCGEGDNSDEFRCKVETAEEDKTMISVGITAAVVVIIIMVATAIGVKRQRRMRRARERLSSRINLNANRLAEHSQFL
uniref:CUB domain-containing protein n=1 Tax=Trichuris muris TaxID=70415 RepID=A0A5S6Q849_TRIMR